MPGAQNYLTRRARCYYKSPGQGQYYMVTLTDNNIAEVDISYSHLVRPSMMRQIKCSDDSYKAFLSLWDLSIIEHVEQFKIMLLSRSNKCLGIKTVSTGGTYASVVDVKVVFQTALKTNASSIILCHNHPSCNMTPSQSDISLTQKVFRAGKLLDIDVLDHLIISADTFYSFADENLMNIPF